MSGSPSLLAESGFCTSGRRTSLPRWSMGVTTMKMMSSTSTTSTSGVMLISALTPLPEPPTFIAMGLLRGLGGLALDLGLGELPGDYVEELVGGLGDVDGPGVDPALEDVV